MSHIYLELSQFIIQMKQWFFKVKKNSQKFPFNLLFITLFFAVVIAHIFLANMRQPAMSLYQKELNKNNEPVNTDHIKHFRVGTYNIHSLKDLNSMNDEKLFYENISPIHILGLNEVKQKIFSKNENQASLIAQKIDKNWIFLPSQKRYHQNYFGNAILSNFPLKNIILGQLPHDQKNTKRHRSYGLAEILINQKKVTVLVTHLETQAPIKYHQLNFLKELIKDKPYVIFMGDLNMNKCDSSIHALIKEYSFTDAIHKVLKTKDQDSRIDWILTKGFEIKTGGIMHEGLSDHPFYWVELQIIH